MNQSLIDDFKVAFQGLTGLGLTANKRADVALGLLAIEHGASGEPERAETLWFDVTDMGLLSEEELRQLLRSRGYGHWESADTDTIMCQFAKSEYYGKVVTPMDQDVPPFYQINGKRESIYQLRLRTQALFDDSWNTANRGYIVQKMRDNGDTVHEL